MQRLRIASLSKLQDRAVRKFAMPAGGAAAEGLLVQYAGQVRAYLNRCQHLPLPLDYGDGRFFSQDGRHLICRNHGALYDPLTGECVRGPCCGARLEPLAVEVDQGEAWLVLPEPADGIEPPPARAPEDRD